MIYLLYGEERYLIDKFIKDEIKKNNIELVNKFNYKNDGISAALEDASYMDLFCDKKAVILDDITFSSKDENEEKLSNYIDNPNENTYLFITCYTSKLDTRKNIVNKLLDKSINKVFYKFRPNDTTGFIKNYFKNENLIISNDLIKMIINRVGLDLYALTNELDKMILYKLNDTERNITKEEIENVISVNAETDVFKLTDAISENDSRKALKIYNDLIENGNKPSALLVLIANNFRLYYQVKILLRDGYSEQEITNILNKHPYQIKLAASSSVNFSESQLLDYLKYLSYVDEDIKKNLVLENDALERFFIYISI